MDGLRILVFSAAFGAGHIKAAEALVEQVRLQAPEAVVEHLDFGEFVNKRVNALAQNIYIEMIKHTPKLWGRVYYQADKIHPDSLIQRFLNSLGRENVCDYIESYQPDLIICTYHVAAGILAHLRRENMLNIPVATVITDYALHGQWVHPGVDMYFVACDDVKEGLIGRGIEQGKIYITGIPVSARFEKEADRGALRESLGLHPDKLTFLVMCGAFGVLDGVKKICTFLGEADAFVQTVVVCGRDVRLYESLREVAEGSKNTMLCLGYSNDVDRLMAASDIIITKAGGLTVTEALTKQLPLIIFKPIPGQEEENAQFLAKNGAALIAGNEDELENHVRYLLLNQEKLAGLKAAATRILPGQGAERPVEIMLDFCRNNRRPLADSLK